MNNIKIEISALEKELNELKKMIEENMQMDGKCVEGENISDILNINKEIRNNLNKLV